MPSRHEQEEYLEQDEAERDSAGRRNSLVALVVLAVLVAAGLLLDRLSSVSALQDCLMTHATNCVSVSPPPSAAPAVRSGASTIR